MRRTRPSAEEGPPPELRCSFCGKARSQVRKLIAGPSVYICNECVELCHQILGESAVDEPPAPSPE